LAADLADITSTRAYRIWSPREGQRAGKAPAVSDDNRWYSVLDDIDAHLEQQERTLAAGRPDLVAAFALPPGLGPVPPNLEPRLDTMRRRTEALEAAIAEARVS
jgi:hypothetical protein